MYSTLARGASVGLELISERAGVRDIPDSVGARQRRATRHAWLAFWINENRKKALL